MTRFRGFIGPSYTMRALNLDCQRTVNLYPEVDELQTGKEHEIAALIGTPGLRLLNTVVGPIRGCLTSENGQLYVVGGSTFYSVGPSWMCVPLGQLSSSTGLVDMADNGTQIMVVDGSHGYIYDPTLNPIWQVITSPNFYGANRVSFQDGYFLVPEPGSGRMRFSGINDGLSWGELDFVTAESSPDNLVAAFSDHREVWMFGNNTTEVYVNTGSQQVFERMSGAIMEIGCLAPFSVCKLNNSVVWLGTNPAGGCSVYKNQGYQAVRISNHPVEFAMSGYGDLSATTAWTYSIDGHQFYCLQFQNAKTTWVYDDIINQWHERTYLDPVYGEIRHRAICHAYAYGTHVVGDWQNGNIYALDMNIGTDNGTEIRRTRISPHLSEDMVRLVHDFFWLDMETGVGLDGTQQGTDPQVMLSWSDDYGHSWCRERWMSIGKMGKFRARAISRRLGVTRDRVYKVAISDPVRVNIVGAELGLKKGRS